MVASSVKGNFKRNHRRCLSSRRKLLLLFAFILSSFLVMSFYISLTRTFTTKTQYMSFPSSTNFAPHAPPRHVTGEFVAYIDNGASNPLFLCLDKNDPALTFSCHHEIGTKSTQSFSHQQDGEIQTGDGKQCLQVVDGNKVQLVKCGSADRFKRDRLGRMILLNRSGGSSGSGGSGGDGESIDENKDDKADDFCLSLISNSKKSSLRSSESDTGVKILPCNIKSRGITTRWTVLHPEDAPSAKKTYDFNEDASKIIGMKRTVPDIRHKQCEVENRKVVIQDLPKTSIIMCFVDEEYWALTRSIISVLACSPSYLIGEILLIDDGSANQDMLKPLEEFVELFPKLKLIRTGGRKGLIKARSIGVENAKFEVLTFLDSHIEVVEGWLEPLLQRLYQEPEIIVTPQIVVINQDNLRFQSSVSFTAIAYGQMNWDLVFHWAYTNSQPPPGPPRLSPIEPIQSPTMAGGKLLY